MTGLISVLVMCRPASMSVVATLCKTHILVKSLITVLWTLSVHINWIVLGSAEESAQQKNGPAETYNPWPGYIFTGKLRPFPVVS